MTGLDAGVAAVAAAVDAGYVAVRGPVSAVVTTSDVPEWLKLLLGAGAGVAAVVAAAFGLLGWWFQTRLEGLKSALAADLAERTERLKADLGRDSTERSERLKADLAERTERLKADLGRDSTERSERLKADLAGDLAGRTENLKAQLAILTQLSTTVQQKRAEVAADALVALLRILDALRAAASPAAFVAQSSVPPEPEAREEAMRREVEARAVSLQPYEEEFRRAWLLTEVYLPEAVLDLFQRVHVLKVEINVNQGMHVATIGHPEGIEFFKKGYGSEPQKQADELGKEARKLLRPLAQLTTPKA